MKSKMKNTAAGLAAFAVAGGVLLAAAGAASAADNPLPWQARELGTGGPIEQSGTLSLYDNSGNVVTSGALSDPLAFFAVGSGGLQDPQDVSTGINAYVATPTAADPGNWSLWPLSLTASAAADNSVNSTYTTLPASIQASSQEVVPLLQSSPGDNESIGQALTNYPSTYPAPNNNVYEIRILGANQNVWYAADIEVNPTVGTWTQVYPTPPAVVATSISAITASPASPAPSGTTSVALSADLSAADGSHPSGTVELFDGTTDLGAASIDGSGHITKTATGLSDGSSHSFQFKYAGSSGYSPSTSAPLTYTVKAPAVATTTVVTGATTGTVGTSQPYTATVSAASGTPTGTVQFFEDGTAIGASKTLSGGAATLSYNPSSAGNHTITAAYTPADPSAFQPSSDTTGVVVAVTAAQWPSDPQNVKVTVPAGSLTISTPYTPSNPFDLGTLKLRDDGTYYDSVVDATHGHFGSAADPASGVTITDTRSNSQGWTASAGTTDFTNGAGGANHEFSGDLLTFTNVAPQYVAGNALNATSEPVHPHDITSNFTTSQDFADTTFGPGSVYVTGDLQLTKVPTSIVSGEYDATITFSIV